MPAIFFKLKIFLKKINITKKEIILLFACCFFFIISFIFNYIYNDSRVINFTFEFRQFLLFLLLIYILYKIYLRGSELQEMQFVNYRQIEAYLSFTTIIKPSIPLPIMRGSAISPDFAHIMVSIMLKTNTPKNIFECGSGISTLILGYCLKKNNNGHIWSLDHENKFTNITKKNLEYHNLLQFVSLFWAPLKRISIDEKEHLWYDTEFMNNFDEKIDLLIIDGPPRSYSKHIRYPALPLLYNYLSSDAIILIDDANRVGEKEIIQQWLNRYNDLSYEWFNTEKGTVVLRKI